MIEDQIIADPKPKVPRKDFVAKIRSKYPQYADIADDDLISKMIEKYPVYADTVEPLKKKDEISPTSGIPFENGPETSLHIPGEVDLGKPLPELPLNEEADKQQSLDKLAKQWADQHPEAQKKDAGFWESLFKRGYDVFANQIPTVPAGVSMMTTPKDYEGFRQQHARDIPIPGKAEFSDKKSLDFWKDNISPSFKKDFDEILSRHPEGGEEAYKEFSGLVEGGLHAVTKENIGELEAQKKDTDELLKDVPVHRNDAGLLDLGYIGGQLGNALATSVTAVTGVGPFLLEQNDAYTSALQKAEEVTGKSKEELVMSDMNKNLAQGATVAGAINSALEFTGLKVMTAPFKKLLVKKLGEEIAKRGVANVLKETVKGTATETVTEGIQDLVTQISSNVSAGKKWDDINWDSTIESILGGAIGGGVISGTSSTIKNIVKSKTKTESETAPIEPQEPVVAPEPEKVVTPQGDIGKKEAPTPATNEKTKPKGTGKRKRAKVPKTVKAEQAPLPGAEKKESEVSGVKTEIVKKETPKFTPMDEEVDQDVIDRHLEPVADKMVEIENHFEKEGYDITDDYDNETSVSKDGEFVPPEDLPEALRKLAGEYETAVSKLGEATNIGKLLGNARKRAKPIDTTADVVESKPLPKPELAPKEEQTSEKARKEGKLVKEGVTYERQKPLEGEDVVKGGPVKLEFANKVNEEAEYAVVEADKIQPSHKKGVQNAVHFLPESQPKQNRNAAFGKAGVKGAQDIAQKLEPEKVAASPNPYSGAPTVNSRGEVIQGNSRADALQQYWENNGDKDPAGYKQYLIDNAEQFGLDPEAIAKMKAPVLTRMTKASDARAIELGQYTASDIETGGKRRIEPVHTVNKLTPEDRTKLANTIAQSEGETLSEIIRANTDKILDILYKRGAITETQLETVRNPRTGEINKEGVEDLARLFRHMMFEGGDTNLGEIFEHLPDAVQKGLDKAIPSIIRTHGLNKIVNNAIIGYREYQKSGMDDMNVWANQADIFNDGLSPAQVYSPDEMNLIRLMDSKKQGEISGKIKEVAAHMADKEGDMFTGPSKGLKAKEAFQKVFVDKGLPENTDSTLPITTRIRNVGKDQFAVTGDTYTIKNRIQALGGVWDKKTQRWIFNNAARPEVEKLLETVDGKNPQAQFAGQRFDGRTVKQVETALRRIGQIQMKALVKRLMSKFPGVSEVVTDKKRFEAAWLKYLATGNPEQTPAGSGVPNGFVYGDKIYLNPETVTFDTPIHEFGHLWWNIVRHKYPVLYAAGQRLIKGSSYLKEVQANPAYSSLSEALQADEALVIAIGEKGAGIADQSAWRRFWSDLWTRLKQGLGIKQNVDMGTMTLNDLVSMAAKELMTPGEIGRISSLHMPETASFRLKGFRMGSEAWEDWNKRVEADRILNLAPETWSRGVKSLRQVFMSSFLTSTQDWTRTIHEVQNEIVDSYITKAQEAIDALSISKQDKKQLSKELKDSRKILTERLIGDTKDVHGLLDLMTGKAEYQIKSMRKWLFGETTSESGYGSLMEFLTKATTMTGKNVLDPKSLAARVNSQGLSLFDVGFYMQVVHSLERNEYNRKLTQGETQAGSGMTDTEANEFLDEIKKSGKEDALKAFAAEIREKLVVEPLNFMHQAGILNQKEYNQLLNYYANYVPLKVQQHQKAGQQGQLSKGVFGTGVKASHGSEQNRYWDRVNPVVHLINNYEAIIAKVESNEVMKKLHKLVTEHPNEQVWKIIRPKKVVTQVVKEGEEDSDSDVGEVKTVVQDFTSPEEKRAIEKESVGVRIGGKQYFIWLKDKDLRKVFVKNKADTPKWLISVMNTIRTIQNYQRATYIGLNLDFPLPNLVRDIQDAAVNLQSLEVKKIGRAVIGGIPTAMSTIFKKNIGKGAPDPVYSQYMEEMKSEGGEISWLDVAGHEEILKEVEQEIDRFKKLTPAQRGGNSLLWLPRKVMRGVVLINKVTEQAIRLSTYVNLREAGVSAHKAAKAAKNVTVNFNKKGSWGPYLNMAWLFANAGIQGANQMATALIKSPKVRAMMVGLILGQIANRFLLDALADDDDDLKKLLTESDHNKNFILWAPWSKHQVVTLPAAYNIRPFKAVGDALYDLYRNNKDFGQATSYVFKNFLNGLFPMAENNFYPSITQPFVELSQNEKFYNQQPIYPEKKHLYQKDSELYFKSTDKPFIKLSGVLSETFHGNDDILEISPATMEYGMDYTLGGLKSWYKLGDQMYNVIDKQQMDMNKMPVVRRFVTDLSTQEWRTKVAFYKLYTEFSRRRLSQEQFDFWKDLGDRLTQEGNMKPDDWNRKRKEILKVQQESFSNVLQ